MQFFKNVAMSAMFLAGISAAAAQTFTVNTPAALVQCQPYLISWSGGTAPYYPKINSPGSISSIIESLAETSATSVSWTVNLAVGQTITILITDSTGAYAASAISPEVAAGTSNSCLNSSSTSSGASTAAASTTSSGSSGSTTSSAASSSTSSSAASSTSTATSSSSGNANAGSSVTSSAASSATSKASNDGNTLRGFAAVVAGTVGVVVAALL